jgi:sugar diacid utilization regulator
LVIEIEISPEGRDPFELPAHPFLVRRQLGVWARDTAIMVASSLVQEHDDLVEIAGPEPAVRATGLVVRAKHKVVELRNGAERERGVMMQIIEDALPAPDFGRLVNIRLEDVVAVVSSDADTGRRVAAALRAHPWCRSLPALPLRVGMDVTEITYLPQCHAEATRAIDIWDRTQPVVHLAEIDIGAYLCRTADATAHRLMPRWIDKLVDKKTATGGHLAGTVAAFADADLNVELCANRLGVHGNTIYHRLNRIHRLMGIDPRIYSGVSALTTALSVSAPRVDRRV